MMALGIAAVSLIVVFRSSLPSRGLHQLGLGISVLELGVALVVIALSQGIGSTLLASGTGLMRAVGRCSYEIYLTHMLVVLGLMPFISASRPEIAWVPVWYAALLISSVALGWVVHHAYSEPLNRALRSRHPSPIDERAVRAAASAAPLPHSPDAPP
jgi:peptidoglycan/LPS O-acetylase OafA/YrhL